MHKLAFVDLASVFRLHPDQVRGAAVVKYAQSDRDEYFEVLTARFPELLADESVSAADFAEFVAETVVQYHTPLAEVMSAYDGDDGADLIDIFNDWMDGQPKEAGQGEESEGELVDEADAHEPPSDDEVANEVAAQVAQLLESAYDVYGPEGVVNLAYSEQTDGVKSGILEMLNEDPQGTISLIVEALVSEPEAVEAWAAFVAGIMAEGDDEAGEGDEASGEGQEIEAREDEGFACSGCGVLVNDEGELCPECTMAEAEFKVGDAIEPVDKYGLAGDPLLVTGVKDGCYMAGYNQAKIGSFRQVERQYRRVGGMLTPFQVRAQDFKYAQDSEDGDEEEESLADLKQKVKDEWAAGNKTLPAIGREMGYFISTSGEDLSKAIEGGRFALTKMAVLSRRIAVDADTEQYFKSYFGAYGERLTRPLAFRRKGAREASNKAYDFMGDTRYGQILPSDTHSLQWEERPGGQWTAKYSGADGMIAHMPEGVYHWTVSHSGIASADEGETDTLEQAKLIAYKAMVRQKTYD